MTGNRQPIRRRSWVSRLRGVALVAVLAISSSALLPLVHGAMGHLGECGVCSVFAHDGASVADVLAPPDLSTDTESRALEPLEPVAVLACDSLDSSEARAPPAFSASI